MAKASMVTKTGAPVSQVRQPLRLLTQPPRRLFLPRPAFSTPPWRAARASVTCQIPTI
jgi:hypothetical protein